MPPTTQMVVQSSPLLSPEFVAAVIGVLVAVAAYLRSKTSDRTAGEAKSEAKEATQTAQTARYDAGQAKTAAYSNTLDVKANMADVKSVLRALDPPKPPSPGGGTGLGPLILLPLLLLAGAGGCVGSTDYDRVYLAKQSVSTAYTVLEASVDNGLLNRQRDARPIQNAIDSAYSAVLKADAEVRAGNKLGLDSALRAVNNFLIEYARLMREKENAREPAVLPDTRPGASGDAGSVHMDRPPRESIEGRRIHARGARPAGPEARRAA